MDDEESYPCNKSADGSPTKSENYGSEIESEEEEIEKESPIK